MQSLNSPDVSLCLSATFSLSLYLARLLHLVADVSPGGESGSWAVHTHTHSTRLLHKAKMFEFRVRPHNPTSCSVSKIGPHSNGVGFSRKFSKQKTRQSLSTSLLRPQHWPGVGVGGLGHAHLRKVRRWFLKNHSAPRSHELLLRAFRVMTTAIIAGANDRKMKGLQCCTRRGGGGVE